MGKRKKLIKQSFQIMNQFNEWLYEACSLKSKYKDAHDIYPTVDLIDARCAFIDGMSPEEYSKEI